MLAGTLALGGLQATPAFADAGTTRTFAGGELCTTAGQVTYNAGAITIDVGKLDPAISEVVIASDAVSGCLGQVTSLNWTGTHALSKLTVQYGAFSQRDMVSTLASVSFPPGLASLQLDENAFYQSASVGDNALQSVTFLDGLNSLSIGSAAFGQEAVSGGSALKSVTFPASLTELSIGGWAFYQYATGVNALQSVHIAGELTSLTLGSAAFYQASTAGDSALSSVTFPAGLTSLVLGYQAFFQSAPGGKTALASIDFPSGLKTLAIGSEAFLQYAPSGATLETVRFPGTLTSLTIGVDAFQQSDTSALTLILDRTEAWPTLPAHTLAIDAAFPGGSPTWYWFGPDGTTLASAWNGTISDSSPNPTLVGYRTLTFDSGAGGSGPGGWYVYRDGRHTSEPKVVGEIASGTWTVAALPSATRDGYDLAGWCTTSASPCPSLALVGDSYTVTAASPTLYANWTLKAPQVASNLNAATVGTAYQARVATGAELVCSVTSGALPAGLSLSGCVLSGTPTAAGASAFTITATNGAGSNSQAFTLTVKHAAPLVTATTLPTPTVTVPYSAPIAVSGGGTITCALSVGSLPPGLKLTGCALTGTATKAGSYPFTVAASNDGGTGSKALTVVVAPAKKFTKVYRPTISGTAKVGRTLTAKVKTWKPTPTRVSWQWNRNGVAIPGATKSKYKLTSRDKGAKITVTTLRSRLGYQSSSTSKSTARVK